jgi:hypothetical protein
LRAIAAGGSRTTPYQEYENDPSQEAEGLETDWIEPELSEN